MFKRKNPQSFEKPMRSEMIEANKVNNVGTEIGKNGVTFIKRSIIFDGGHNGYAIATGETSTGKRVCAIRWNGNCSTENKETGQEEKGTPIQGNIPAWFILPEFLNTPVIKAAFEQGYHDETDWLDRANKDPENIVD